MITPEILAALKAKYIEEQPEFDDLRQRVVTYFERNPKAAPYVHSVKSRLKDPGHLESKIKRNWSDASPTDVENLFCKITDLAGVRVLLLHQQQFCKVKEAVESRIARKEWFLVEQPKAYTWDPEAKIYFESLGLTVHTKDSFYTSVHYLVRGNQDSPVCCEIQIRTLFEEIWGEVDHTFNYPMKNESQSCRDQILVLAKLIGAGSRLVDSIFALQNKQSAPNSDDDTTAIVTVV